mmetsp:Transcript_7629/g.20256  ORF Transcript_7629/g.20256 Transcript_7629/m.20256 type:complete len:202 (+) Transcript_7629:73-678(+)|eukprot:CAMPEP_0185838958 /NCGR_PEP_ID=MMETSP1353-20130828/13831_1 /TAXON_ID=1077150 /ORGANISM="Erythrolobus australicus, Strain CCMP3124" /LENGTH=201 /DNA_ID=CAMNT_0028538063 /DNA_START=69 /DNA_END=674 /DNA_ORIENTATION=+
MFRVGTGCVAVRRAPGLAGLVVRSAPFSAGSTISSTEYSHRSSDSRPTKYDAWEWKSPSPELQQRAPLPPFTAETALVKVKAAEAAWNSRDPHKVAQAYSLDSVWRNRDQIFRGRDAIVRFLTSKWQRELDYRLEKNLWTFSVNRIAVRFEYEYRDALSENQSIWYRCHGNELWEFDELGYMRWRDMSGNDIRIDSSDRRL